MGLLLHAGGVDSRALDFYVKALKLKPNDPDVLAEVRNCVCTDLSARWVFVVLVGASGTVLTAMPCCVASLRPL